MHLVVMIALLGLAPLGCGGDDRPEGEPSSLQEWKALRAYHDENVWENETIAQEYEMTLVAIWDALLGVDDDFDEKIAILSSIQFDQVTLGTPKLVEELDHGTRALFSRLRARHSRLRSGGNSSASSRAGGIDSSSPNSITRVSTRRLKIRPRDRSSRSCFTPSKTAQTGASSWKVKSA